MRSRAVNKGVTGISRVTLSDGKITHDAAFQAIDEAKTQFQAGVTTEINFRDSWKYSVAAYRLDKVLGLNMIPATVERKHAGNTGAMTWWVDDVLMEETQRMKKNIRPPDMRDWNYQIQIMRVFDQLIHNVDRNTGNILITKGWRMWMIDHTRAFRLSHDLRDPQKLATCDRDLLAAIKTLTQEQLEKELMPWLTKTEIRSLLIRRDKIVQHFEQAGESVLYTWLRRTP